MKQGKILWYSDRDQNGIITDSDGNQFYFDISVLKTRDQVIKRQDKVAFIVNDKITDCLCAKNIEVIS